MSKLTAKEFDKLYNRMLKAILDYSDHLIVDHISSTSMSLTNGFTVTFKDRKSSKTRAKETLRKNGYGKLLDVANQIHLIKRSKK